MTAVPGVTPVTAPDVRDDSGRYMDGIARTAMAIVDDIRETDPYVLLEQLTLGCGSEPMRMAQVIMALAAMMPTDETIGVINRRVWAISAARSVA